MLLWLYDRLCMEIRHKNIFGIKYFKLSLGLIYLNIKMYGSNDS